ncbi:hypothetical protein AA313_de0202010 [Arthrobotrys entomopaga]|nr:hypothetical protein AA313_de0202010 [Arthrobotrys entomopaga]
MARWHTRPSLEALSILSLLLFLLIDQVQPRYVGLLWAKIIKDPKTGREKIQRWDGDAFEIPDTEDVWQDGECEDLEVEDSEVLQEVKYYAGRINVEFPFFLRRVLIYEGYGCEPQNLVPDATVNLENLDLTESEQKKWQKPEWLLYDDIPYGHRPEGYFSIGHEVHIENLDTLPGRDIPDGLKKWPDPRDYREYGKWETALEKHNRVISAQRGIEHINQIADQMKPSEYDESAYGEDNDVEEWWSELNGLYEVAFG